MYASCLYKPSFTFQNLIVNNYILSKIYMINPSLGSRRYYPLICVISKPYVTRKWPFDFLPVITLRGEDLGRKVELVLHWNDRIHKSSSYNPHSSPTSCISRSTYIHVKISNSTNSSLGSPEGDYMVLIIHSTGIRIKG
jgi:hypothetical protein